LVDDVRAAIANFTGECGLDLEVTESMLMENFDSAIAKLNAIRDLGVQLSLDDFGTGYSSLAYIHRLPLNALKIDRSFIQGMDEDPDKTTVVSTIISLAQALRLKVIAEGVETEEQFRLLQLLRCDEIQGYLIGKPEPPETAVRFIRPS
jgi:EAL domain-containing protein (putative c-di-GMP-specific phosphodiesterase class I)